MLLPEITHHNNENKATIYGRVPFASAFVYIVFHPRGHFLRLTSLLHVTQENREAQKGQISPFVSEILNTCKYGLFGNLVS